MRKNKNKEESEEFRRREERTKEWLTDQSRRAHSLRSKEREFHGLEREFVYHQEDLLTKYAKSKDVKHPRDVGRIREVILRDFLTESGYLPKRYAISELSTRVASTSGHISNEIDIAVYDPLNSFSLMKQSNVYEVLPVESVYGVIQVKSQLTKTEIEKGLLNIASFKRLRRKEIPLRSGFLYNDPNISDHGFGLLFAYDSDLDWLDIIKHIESFAAGHKPTEWANAIFILNKGFFMHGQGHEKVCITNGDMRAINQLQMHGRPDREGLCLYAFNMMLLQLLRGTSISMPTFEDYFRLPQVAGEHSYQFHIGYFAELATCPKHGDYQRKITGEQLGRVIDWCKSSPRIDIGAAEDEIYKVPKDFPSAIRKHMVHLYNPENLPLKDILTAPSNFQGKQILAIGYDSIIIDGSFEVCIPYYYSQKEGIIANCPKCRAR